jgi:hypothetical protein
MAYLGPVLLELLNSLEVEISLSSKELVFKPFIGAAGFDIFFTIAGSWHTPAFHSFPSSHRNAT